jgi:signal transduction histidine kinase
MGFRFAQDFYQLEAQDQLEQIATHQSDILSQSINRYGDTVGTIKSLFSSSDTVTREEFSAFVQSALQQFPAIQALGVNPRVTSAERDSYERAAQRDGLSEFQFVELAPDKTMVRAGVRNEYFPAYFLEPLASNKRALGFDLGSNPARLAALNKARDTGMAVATQRIRLVQEQGTQSGFLLFVPIFRNGAAINTIAQRRAALEGFGTGVFKIEDMIVQTLDIGNSPTGLDLYVFEDSAPAAEQVLAFVPSPDADNRQPLSIEALHNSNAFTVSHAVGGRNWKFMFAPAPGHFTGASSVPYSVLAVGLFLSLGVAWTIYSAYSRVRLTQQLVDQRTTELTATNNNLKQAQQRLLDAIEAFPNGFLLFDSNDRLVLHNSLAKQVTPYLKSKLAPGLTFRELTDLYLGFLDPDCPEAERDELTAARMEAHQDMRDHGHTVSVEQQLSPGFWVHRSHNRTAEGGSLMVLSDVSDINIAHQDLVKHSRELERSNADLEQFAYVASHDLKAPLRAIDNLAGWIEEDVSEHMSEDSREHMTLLRSRITRLEALLEGLLRYARAGRDLAETSWVDTGALVSEAVELLGEPEFVNIEIPGNMPQIQTSAAALQQVFRNLIGNAVKHRDRDDVHVKITWKDLGSVVEFSVIDDGPGIPEQFHDRIFQMFQTLRRRDEVEGSGLGLAMVQKLVRTHGGEIDVISRDGERGSVFRFTWANHKMQAESEMQMEEKNVA